MYEVGNVVLVRLPFYNQAKIHTIYPDGSIGLEIKGNRLYCVREKHILRKRKEK
jgi:hypothetical protein